MSARGTVCLAYAEGHWFKSHRVRFFLPTYNTVSPPLCEQAKLYGSRRAKRGMNPTRDTSTRRVPDEE